ncbi:MAG: type II secretion system F family protein [Pirellulaceae bacterium]
MFQSLRKLCLQRIPLGGSSWRITRWWKRDLRNVSELSLLRLLAVAHRERLDVRPLVGNLTNEFRGAARRRLARLSRRLAEGMPLVDALDQTPDALRDEDVLSLRFASGSGTLPQTYAELIERAQARSADAALQVRQALKYGFVLAIVFSLLIAMMMTFISPTFKKMFEEFGLRLPATFAQLISTTDWIARYLPLMMLFGLLAFGFIWFVRPIRHLRRWFELRPLRASAQLQRAHLLRMLAQASGAGRPLPSSLSTLARYHFSRNTRVKLLVARNDIELGADPWGTLAASQLINSNEAQSLSGASSPRLRTWIMRRLAMQKEQVVYDRRATLAMLVHPAVVLFFGAIVAWVAVSFFSILVSMILSLS